jgi:uncharacterized protein (TIGR03118 family)
MLGPNDLLVSNFNGRGNLQGTGTTIVRINPDGHQSLFFQGQPGLGLTTALGVLKSGFVLVGSVPSTDGTSNTVGQGSLLIIDRNGHLVKTVTDSDLLNGPWDMTIQDNGSTAEVFVSNVLSGTVTRLNLRIPAGAKAPIIVSETQIGSGYAHTGDPVAFELGPTGLAFDNQTDTLYVASTDDNAIYAIRNAATTTGDGGRGRLVYRDQKHLHGPLGLAFAPNGDLLTANGDAVNPDPKHTSEIVEFTKTGNFVAQLSIDPVLPDEAFGIAVATFGGKIHFAAVDDNNNTVKIFTVAQPKAGEFFQTDLTSDLAGISPNQDMNLSNPWGVASFAGGPFWVSNNNTGTSTLYNGAGVPQKLVVQIPAAPGSAPGTLGMPSGIVANGGGGFNVSEKDAKGVVHTGSGLFIFATTDGTISAWNPGVDLHHAILEVNNSAGTAHPASYTGLAIGKDSDGRTLLYAANALGGIDVFDDQFRPTSAGADFVDTHILAGTTPYNIQNIGGKLYVTYSNGSNTLGNGFVDVFSTDGVLLQRLISHGPLVDPWGLVIVPPTFGQFPNALLVGNVGDGHINAFDPKSGAFLGQLKGADGQPLTIGNLWSLKFGTGGKGGDPNTLYFTAGIGNYGHGLFGSIQPIKPVVFD